jgi:hypothetical protein
MNGAVVGILAIVSGFCIVVFRKPFARGTIRHQNDFFGFRFGKREVRRTEYIALLGGISSIGFGLYILFLPQGTLGEEVEKEPIHRSAGKVNSPKFAFTAFSEVDSSLGTRVSKIRDLSDLLLCLKGVCYRRIFERRAG